jgi:hypothetical protein
MKFTAQEIERRYQDFPMHIIKLGLKNSIVSRILRSYAHGVITTRDEALCMMVMQMSEDMTKCHEFIMESTASGKIVAGPGLVCKDRDI